MESTCHRGCNKEESTANGSLEMQQSVQQYNTPARPTCTACTSPRARAGADLVPTATWYHAMHDGSVLCRFRACHSTQSTPPMHLLRVPRCLGEPPSPAPPPTAPVAFIPCVCHSRGDSSAGGAGKVLPGQVQRPGTGGHYR